VTETGQKQLVALQLATTEATTAWSGLLGDLQRRGLPAPLLVVTDGHAGLKKALDAWPTVRVQRCTTHKGRNLDDACPVHARPELHRDYHRIIFATDGLAARAAYDAFVKKWTTLCPPVARSLEEAGLDLLTFYSFPKAMWKSLRTTEASALTVLFGLVAVGQIVFRKIDGHQELAAFLLKEQWSQAA
jgi:transposase-like protein